MIRLCYSDISAIDPEHIDSLLSSVPSDRAERAKRVMNADMRGCILASYVLCKGMLSDVGITTFDIAHDEYGKPALVPSCGVHFNLSYSSTVVSCCIADNEIGVDVERIGRIELSVARRFFHQNEYDEILSCGNPEMAVTRLWTIKESMAKCIGKGISRELLCGNLGRFSQTALHTFFFSNQQYNVNEYFLPGYCFSVCSTTNELPSRLERIKLY